MISIDDGETVRKYVKASLFQCADDGEIIIICLSDEHRHSMAIPFSPEQAIRLANAIIDKACDIRGTGVEEGISA